MGNEIRTNNGPVNNGTVTTQNFYYNNGQTPHAPKFYFPLVKNLIERDTEVEKLYDIVSNNQFSNFYGLGGSGKTSLVNLLVEKHKDKFNQIACVVVNDNMEETFVNKINETIKLDFDGVKDRCVAVFSYLREQYESEKTNLMVLDVNSMDWQDVKDFVDKLNDNYFEYVNGWHFLIISRESFSEGMSSMELSADDDSNNDFLKELFLRKAGDDYEDFQDFDELFRILFHNPLLVELLGIKLKNKHKHSLEEIKKILGDPKYYEGSTKGGLVNSKGKKKEEQILIGYLCNLVSFEGLSDDEKKLVRHFVIWPTDYIDKEVIKKLLDGIFESDEVLTTVLDNLQSRGLLSLEENDGNLKYKLHGLIAESVRKQIKIEFSDYLQYNDNVSDIIKLDYWSFVPFAECIGHSFANFNICIDYKLLRNILNKFRVSFIGDYSMSLSQKALSYISAKLETIPDSIMLNNDLADIYNEIAKLQETCLFDYANARINYLKVFEIMDKLPLSDMQLRNNMVVAYYNFAEFQLYRLNDYSSSELYFKKAIELGEILPKNNHAYQNNNAFAYMKMGLLYHRFLKRYSDAEYCYNKAVSVRLIMPNTKEYSSNLACVYLNLALLYCDCLKDNSHSLDYFKKAISMFESLHTDDPSCNHLLASAYHDLALFYVEKLNNISIAKMFFNKAIELSETLPMESSFLHNLAWTYLSYANVEDNVDVCFDCYSKAISIFEKLPKVNMEYLGSLAAGYYKFAIFITKTLKQYSWAEHYFIESIKLYTQLSCVDSGYQLAQVYNNLAVLQYSYLGDIDSSKSNYERAVEIYEKLLCTDSTVKELLVVIYKNIINMYNELGEIDGVAKYEDKLIQLGD